jgi:hypothetical protein
MTVQADRLVTEAQAETIQILRSIESAQARAAALVQKILGAGGLSVIDDYDWGGTDLSKSEFLQAMAQLQNKMPAVLDGQTTLNGDPLYVLETKL